MNYFLKENIQKLFKKKYLHVKKYEGRKSEWLLKKIETQKKDG